MPKSLSNDFAIATASVLTVETFFTSTYASSIEVIFALLSNFVLVAKMVVCAIISFVY